jgi:hypothetical protein
VSLRGDKGDAGAKGDKGEPGARGRRGEGMPRGARRAIVSLFAITVALSLASILFAVGYYHREAAAQQRQGEQLEAKLCATLDKLAALRPPSGSPLANPSRAFDQKLYRALNELAPDLGCGVAGRRA